MEVKSKMLDCKTSLCEKAGTNFAQLSSGLARDPKQKTIYGIGRVQTPEGLNPDSTQSHPKH